MPFSSVACTSHGLTTSSFSLSASLPFTVKLLQKLQFILFVSSYYRLNAQENEHSSYKIRRILIELCSMAQNILTSRLYYITSFYVTEFLLKQGSAQNFLKPFC